MARPSRIRLGTAAAGSPPASGTATLTLGGFSLAATGEAATPASPASGNATLTLGGFSFGSTGTAYGIASGTGVMTLGGFSLSGTGEAYDTVSGSGTLLLGGFSLAASGVVSAGGTGVLTLGGFSLAATGAVATPVIGTATFVLGGFSLAATGEAYDTVTATASMVLGGFSLSGTGSVGASVTGSGTLQLGGFSFASTGSVSIDASGTLLLGGFSLAATGSAFAPITGSGVLSLAGFSLEAFGTATGEITGNGTLTLGGFSFSSSGVSISGDPVTGSGVLTLGGFTFSSSGTATSPVEAFCGVGGSNFPAPGDPDLNNIVLSATPVFNAIRITWSYPGINPEALAYTLLYRSTVNDFSTATQIAVVAGNIHLDPSTVTSPTTYYYWVKLVSVHGTIGNLIGPATAVMGDNIADIIAMLENQIGSSQLALDLRTEISTITDVSSAVTDEMAARLLGDTTLQTLWAQVDVDLAAIDTLILDEVLARTTADSAAVATINGIYAVANDNAAAIQTEKLVAANATGAVALQVDTIQATVDGQNVSIQTMQTVVNQATTDVSTLGSAVTGLNSQVSGLNGTVGAHDDALDEMYAEYYVKLDVDGYVSGFGQYNNGSSASFLVHADTFAIGKPGATIDYPFIVSGGVVYMKSAMIQDLAVTNAKINNLAVDTLKIKDNAVTIPNGANGTVAQTLNTSYQKIGSSMLLNWGADEQPTALIANAAIQTSGGSVAQSLTIEVRRVYGTGAYNGNSSVQSFAFDQGGSLSISGYFVVASTAYSYVNIEVWAKVSTGTRPVTSYSLSVFGSKK
jgi:hypothetical protein